jgi:hypothetical protein
MGRSGVFRNAIVCISKNEDAILIELEIAFIFIDMNANVCISRRPSKKFSSSGHFSFEMLPLEARGFFP